MDTLRAQDMPGQGRIVTDAPVTPSSDARLRAIHDLIRAGEYRVSASAIADRMVERLMAEKRDRQL